jgi:aminoglycoside phosphotransferase (APT) family kinase protein
LTSTPEDLHDLAQQLNEFLRSKLGKKVSLVGHLTRLKGGFDTDTYAFSIENAPRNFPHELVLRHFQHQRESRRVILESTIQNEAHKAGHPVPQVPIDSNDYLLDDRPFLIMERLPGAALGSQVEDESVLPLLPHILAKLQLGLHKLDATHLLGILDDLAIDTSTMSPKALLSRIGEVAIATNEPDLLAIKSWLDDNWPTQPQTPTICHGDLHPNNILFHDQKVTGLIDWGNVMFTHPEFDVAITRLTISSGPPEMDSAMRSEMQPLLDQLIAGYLAVYRSKAPLDDELIDYYATLRSAHAYAKVIGSRQGVDLSYIPGDGYAWSMPRLFENISNVIESSTGLKLKTS